MTAMPRRNSPTPPRIEIVVDIDVSEEGGSFPSVWDAGGGSVEAVEDAISSSDLSSTRCDLRRGLFDAAS
jgi:hypothetical protein